MNRPQIFTRYRQDIEDKLREIISQYRSPLYGMIQYHLGWTDETGSAVRGNPGKALRPSLCLFACEALCGDHSKALTMGAALELVHNYSLIHDDIQDNDEERRHRATVWKVWGRAQAINAGTAAKVIANLALREYYSMQFSPQRILEMSLLLEETALTLIEGQYLDISFETRKDIGLDEYLSMIQKKTGALVAASLMAGALTARDDRDTAEMFYRLGMAMGTAFQVRDDILGIWGSRDITGKSSASDIEKKKKTLPVVHLFINASPADRSLLDTIYAKNEPDSRDVAAVIGLLEKYGSKNYAEALVNRYSAECMDMILKLPLDVEHRQELAGITQFLASRAS